MSQANPFDQFDGHAAAPAVLTGPPPKPADAPTPFQIEDQQFQRSNEDRRRKEWEATHNPDGTEKPKVVTDGKPTEFQTKDGLFYNRMLTSERQYRDTPAGDRDARTTPGQWLHETAPNVDATFNSSGRVSSDNAARDWIAASLRVESGAAIGPKEYDNQYRIFFPMPGDTETQIREKAIKRHQAMLGFKVGAGPLAPEIEAQYKSQFGDKMPWDIPILPGDEQKKDANGNPIAATAGGDNGGGNNGGPNLPGKITFDGPPNAWEQAANDQENSQHVASGATKYEYDAAASQHMWDMWRAGKSQGEITAYANSKGYEMPLNWDDKKVQARDKAGLNPFHVGKEVPTTMLNRVAGGKTGSFISGAADTATLGFNDELYGLANAAVGNDYQQAVDKAQGAKAAMAENHPGASLAGSLVGGALTAPLAAGVAGKFAPGLVNAARANPIVTAGGVGAVYGAGENNDNRVAGAALGGLTGLAGGALGEKVIGPGLVRAVNSRPGQAVINGVSSIPQRARGLVGNATPLSEDGAALVAAGERQGIPIRKPDAVPEARNAMASAEASPYGGGVINNALNADKQAVQNRLAEIGGPGESAAGGDANTIIGGKVQDAGAKYIDRTRLKKNDLYGQAEKAAGGQRIVPENAIAAIDKHIGELEAAGANTNAPQINYLKGLREDMAKPDGFSISEFQGLRSSASQKIKGDQALTVSDADRRLADVTKAFTADAEAQLPAEAVSKLAQADKYYAERQDFISNTLKSLVGTRGRPKSAEETGKAMLAMARNKADHAKLSRFLDEVDPATRADYAATVAEQLGKGRNGEFGLGTLATNIENTPSNIRQTLFGTEGNQALKDLQAIARAKSDTAGGLNQSKSGVVMVRDMMKRMLVSAGAGGFATGSGTGAVVAPLMTELVAAIGQKRAAKLLLNPKFTGLIRTAPKQASPAEAAAWLERVSKLGTSNPVIATEVSNVVPLFEKALGLSPLRAAAAPAGQDKQN